MRTSSLLTKIGALNFFFAMVVKKVKR